MIARFILAAGIAAITVAGGIGVGSAAASPEKPRGTMATCPSMRDWAINVGEKVDPCYYDPKKDSYVFDTL
ncbi:hypothetical protein [Nocardia sp. X0981]